MVKQHHLKFVAKTLAQIPVPMVGAVTSGAIPAATFKAMGGLRAKLKDSEFDETRSMLS